MKTFRDYFKEQTWNGGFTNIFLPSPARHRKPIINDPRFRKHPQTVPDMHRSDASNIAKVENLKNAVKGKQPLSTLEVKRIVKKYNLSDLGPNKSRTLGNTGITIKFDPNYGSYFLEK